MGQKSYWNLILPLENKIGRWIEIWVKSNHWIITQRLGFNSGRQIISIFNLDHQMYIKLTVGTQTKSGPSDQCGETESRWMSSRCKTPLTKLHMLPLLSPPCQSGSKRPSSSSLLTGHIVTARRTHHRCSLDPSPLLAEPIPTARQTHRPACQTHCLNSLSLSLSAMKSTHLQALTPPSSAINASVQHRRFDEYRYNFFSKNQRKITEINRNKTIFLRNFPTGGDFLKKSPKFLFLPKFRRNFSDFWRNFWIFLSSTFCPPLSFRCRSKHEISPKFRRKKQKFSSLLPPCLNKGFIFG